MFANLSVFRIANAMATHAGQRQAVVSQNIANADTPGYAARDIAPFSQFIDRSNSTSLHGTRPGHILDRPDQAMARQTGSGFSDTNTVSIEDEMLKAVETDRQHSRALAIYKSSLRVLRTSIG